MSATNVARRNQAGGAKRSVFPVTENTALEVKHMFGYVTTRGATGAVVITLPPAATFGGYWVFIANVADQDLTIQGSSGELVAFNEESANSVSLETGGEKVGGGFHCFCDGTSWIILEMTNAAATVTITT